MKLTLLFLFISVTLFGQDSTFYDNNWNPCPQSEAEYLRVLTKTKKRWKIEDFYISGQLQMTGYLNSTDPTDRHGDFKWFNQDGVTIQTGTYQNGKKDGKIVWYYDNGTIQSIENYKDGVTDGEYEAYHENGNLSVKGKSRNGKLHGLTQYWYSNGVKKVEGFFTNGIQDDTWKFWNEDGSFDEEINFQAVTEINDCKLSVELPTNDWYFNGEQKTSTYNWFEFKRKPIVNSEGISIIPNISILYEEVDDNLDVIVFSALKRRNTPIEVDSVLTHTDHRMNLERAIGYIGTTVYENGDEHTVYLIHAINNGKGIQIFMDMTSDVFENYGTEFNDALRKITLMK